MSIISVRRSVQHASRGPMIAIMPITKPMLATFEPNMSPTVIPMVPCTIENTATVISGMEVMTERITNPAEASPRPVSSISSSIDFIAKWLAIARTPNETAINTP